MSGCDETAADDWQLKSFGPKMVFGQLLDGPIYVFTDSQNMCWTNVTDCSDGELESGISEDSDGCQSEDIDSNLAEIQAEDQLRHQDSILQEFRNKAKLVKDLPIFSVPEEKMESMPGSFGVYLTDHISNKYSLALVSRKTKGIMASANKNRKRNSVMTRDRLNKKLKQLVA